jgi:hypothetical protein
MFNSKRAMSLSLPYQHLHLIANLSKVNKAKFRRNQLDSPRRIIAQSNLGMRQQMVLVNKPNHKIEV